MRWNSAIETALIGLSIYGLATWPTAQAREVVALNPPDGFACSRGENAAPLKPDGYAFIVGNRDYQGGTPIVEFAHNDAAAICDYVVNDLGYAPDQVFVLFDLDRTQLERWFKGIGDAKSNLQRLTQVVGEELEVLVYYSGHGVPHGDSAYLLPVNIPPTDVGAAGLAVSTLTKELEGLDAKRALLMLEACFSGRTGGGEPLVPSTSYAVTGAPIEPPPSSVSILSAAGPSEVANWAPDRAMGLYTSEFLDAVRGRANSMGNGDGTVTLAELATDLARNVTKRSLVLDATFVNRLQTPEVQGSLELWEFPAQTTAIEQPVTTPSHSDDVYTEQATLVPPSDAPARLPEDIEREIGLIRADWREIQRALNAQGYDIGSADGLPGNKTRQGIKSWQRENNDPITGFLERDQVVVLLDLADDLPSAVRPAVGTYDQDPPFEPGDRFKDCGTCPEMVVIPPGSFMMGSTEEERQWVIEQGSDASYMQPETPRHPVDIPRAFAIGRHEVTRGQFEEFIQATGHDMSGGCLGREGNEVNMDPERDWRDPDFDQDEQHPVICVSWNDASAYVEWLSAKTSATYRLPSEAEWEYSARAGSVTRRPWGDDRDDRASCDYANGRDERARGEFPGPELAALNCDDGFTFTAPIGSFPENAFGLHDMLGNAFEWVEDCWNDSYRDAPGDGSARVSGDCGQRASRGGYFDGDPRVVLRSAYRASADKAIRVYATGFRVVRDLD